MNNNLSNLQHCGCKKETGFEFCSVKQNTVEEFDFECSVVDEGKKSKSSRFLSLKPQLDQDMRNFDALSFLVNGP